jgi:Mrp family chromosome partitioning ATPase
MQMTLPSRKTAATPDVTRLSSFRNLYTRVLLGLQAQQHPILGVTSAIAGEGKTTVASGLATALAEDGALLGFGRKPGTILLVQCNAGSLPDDPRLALRLGPGLIEVLRGESELDGAIQEGGVERLAVLPLGEPAHNFPLAIRTAALPDVIAQLRSRYGLIVLDLPAVLNSTDTQVLARLADQLILVVRAEVTPAKLVKQALDELGEERVLGMVLNDSRPDLPPWLEHRL